MLRFLILSAIFANSITNATSEQKLETIKESLNEQEKVFSKELPKAEAASDRKYAELEAKFKDFEEQCKTLDTLMREKFEVPNFLTQLNPSKRFDIYYKEKGMCEDFLKLDAHLRFEQDSRYHQLYQLGLDLKSIERRTIMESEEMKMLSGLNEESIKLLIEHYDKIGNAIEELEESLEKLQSGSKEEQTPVKISLKAKCKGLEDLIKEISNLPDEVVPNIHTFYCEIILNPHAEETEQQATRNINHFKESLQRMKETVGSANHMTETRKLHDDVAHMESVKKLIETYQSIGKANAELKITLQECKDLYLHKDIKAGVQIKYFADLVKIGQIFAENLRKCLHDGKPEDQKSALKKEKDEFVKKLSANIHYNGAKQGGPNFISYVYVYSLDHYNVVENRKDIFRRIKLHSKVLDCLNAEKEHVIDAEKATMENALQIIKVYKEQIDAIEEDSPTSSNETERSDHIAKRRRV